jgi:large subunit ribosomal protein L29
LRGRNNEQLRADLEAAHQSLFNLRFQGATRQLADVSQIAKAKKRVARAKTLLREQEILAEVDAAHAAASPAQAAGSTAGDEE